MKWRKWNYILHRDIGYLCVGLTLVYAISGIVVNHISHNFNPSYSIDKVETRVAPLPSGENPDMEFIESVLQLLNEKGTFKNAAFISPGNLRIFVEGNTIDLELETGVIHMERVERRPILYELNYLHLNKGKGVWTWLADLYAVALALVAITGLLMMRKNNRIRAIILTSGGVAIPLIYLISAGKG